MTTEQIRRLAGLMEGCDSDQEAVALLAAHGDMELFDMLDRLSYREMLAEWMRRAAREQATAETMYDGSQE